MTHPILTHRCSLTATIHILSDCGITLNGDSTVATHQSRVTMSLQASTSTEHIAVDDGDVTCHNGDVDV